MNAAAIHPPLLIPAPPEAHNPPMSEEGESFGARAEAARARAGVKWAHVYEVADIPESTLEGWRRRGPPESVEKAVRLARVLGTTVEELVTGEAPAKPSGAYRQAVLEALPFMGEEAVKAVQRVLRRAAPVLLAVVIISAASALSGVCYAIVECDGAGHLRDRYVRAAACMTPCNALHSAHQGTPGPQTSLRGTPR